MERRRRDSGARRQVSARERPANGRPPRDSWRGPLLLLLAAARCWAPPAAAGPQVAPGPAAGPNDFQLVARAGAQARLPCLIGRQLYCGEPYFIAWYKFNASARSWTRIEHKSQQQDEWARPQDTPTLNSRVQFVWARGQPEAAQAAPTRGQPATGACLAEPPGRALANQFDCAQLSISALELADEGQYKCEITFSEALDFDKCPASTLSQLNVIASPNEPEILVNGRPAGSGRQQPQLTFKEGAQVRLECQSSGGKPAPRIEWLNVSSPGAGQQAADLQLMRAHWPQKKTTTSSGADNGHQAPGGQPVTSSSVTITLSRHDLQSRFVCLVLAQTPGPNEPGLPASVRSPAQLAGLLDQVPMLASPTGAASGAPMLKWIKLDVLVRPQSVAMQVRDLATGALVAQSAPAWPGRLAAAGWDAQAGEPEPEPAPFYSVQPNRLYAIQCLVEGSRPRSQVAWFNRTAPVEAHTSQLEAADYLVPAGAGHRLSSFARYVAQADGTFRTVASLLLTTSVWDNLEELFCRVSNEAFQFDELAQVAPIISARLYVNYPPSIWLDAEPGQLVKWAPDGKLARLSAEPAGQLSLRCHVAANPIAHNAILQIDWLKDGRPLAPGAAGRQNQATRIKIEKSNHLHMPVVAGGEPGHQQRPPAAGPAPGWPAAGRLMAASSLAISRLVRADSGAYSCQYKLIPAPGAGQSAGAQLAGRLGSAGQAGQSIQVNVAEAKLAPPIVRVSSSAGLLAYDRPWPAPNPIGSDKPAGGARPRSTVVVVVSARAEQQINLKCDLANLRRPFEFGHKVLWYSNGAFLHSSSTTDVYNFSLAARDQAAHAQASRLLDGPISCAHHLLESSAIINSPANFHANSMRVYPSANDIDLRLQVGPRILARRDLMPQVRSFSEPELGAQSASKLRLTCLAQCEPVCSVDWYVNEHLMTGSLASQPDDAIKQRQFASLGADYQQQQNQTQILLKSAIRLQSPDSLSSFWLVENLIQRRNGSTDFAWLKQMSLASELSGGSALDSLSWQLAKEADAQLASSRANVFTKIELTYNQIGLLLSRAAGQPVTIKCKLNPFLGGQRPADFKYAQVEPLAWFPAGGARDETAAPDERDQEANLVGVGQQDAMSSEPLSLAAIFDGQDLKSVPIETDKLNGGQLEASDEHRRKLAPLDSGETTRYIDEMQTSLMLDKPPNGVEITLAGSLLAAVQGKPADELLANGLNLAEAQLADLVDPNKAAPVLECRTRDADPFPQAKFKWTFTDLNQNESDIDTNGSTMNVRQFVELRQRQAQVGPPLSGFDLIASVVGNYTCSASNVHGTARATLPIRFKGRPFCKLNLGGQLIGAQGELLVSLRCSIYSLPALVETIWFRNSQQVAVNKSEPQLDWSAGPARQPSQQSPIWSIGLAVLVLSKQQDFMLTDLMTQSGNFKCVARNSLGYSEACELSQAEKQILLGTFKPTTLGKSPALQMLSAPAPADQPNGVGKLNAPINLLANNSSIEVGKQNLHQQPIAPLVRSWLSSRLDWILIGACTIVLIWLLTILGSALVRRRYSAGYPPNKFHLGPKSRPKVNRNTSWRFNASRASSTNEISGASVPFGQSKVCVNYYGDSNGGDSEHDMVQSCSQSSHYEDFVQHQLQQRLVHQQQQQQQQLQPVYFSNRPTTTGGIEPTQGRLPLMKLSLSSSSTCGETLGATSGRQAPVHSSRLYGHHAGSTMRNESSLHNISNDSSANMTTLASNVPIVNGAHNTSSRIHLDHHNHYQQKQHYDRFDKSTTRDNMQQLTFGKPPTQLNSTTRQPAQVQEHIYDDVIYNQMIL